MITKLALVCMATLLFPIYVYSKEEAVLSLCKADEYQYFSCRISGSVKVVSLCGNVNLAGPGEYEDHDNAYLQYRFGKPENIEMLYPKTKKNSFKKFGGENIRTYFGALQEIGFSVGGYRYNVSSESFTQNEERTDVKEFYGVKVTKDNSLTPKEI